MSLLTDEQMYAAFSTIAEEAAQVTFDEFMKDENAEYIRRFGRAIEAATTAKYAERIAELEREREQFDCPSLSALGLSSPSPREYGAALSARYKAKIADLQAKLDAAAVDAERLNYIEQNARCDPKMDGQHVWWPTSFNRALKGPTLRDAIDAMRTGEPKV